MHLIVPLALAAFVQIGGADAAPQSAALVGSHAVRPAGETSVVEAVEAAYRKSYVFPEKVPGILAKLNTVLKAGRYRGMGGNELAGLISSDLQEASHDGHAYLHYDPQRYAAAVSEAARGGGPEEISDFDVAIGRREHQGLVEMRVLPGNVRYLRIAAFRWTPDESGQAYDDAMRFLRGGDSVIIDLRGNGGGAGEAVQYLVSHFLKPGTLDITILEAGHDPVQVRALENLPAGRMLGKPLYVLIDKSTGSAAEAFAYDVKQFKLGTLVGTVTAGAANNNEFVPISPGYILSVSTGRPVHAVSKTNWEGVGISPDLETSSPEALDQAYVSALRSLIAASPPEQLRVDYLWALPAAEARLHPVLASRADLAAAPGKYGEYVVSGDQSALTIAGPGHVLWFPRKLRPLSSTGLFAIDGVETLRVRIGRGALELWSKGQSTPVVVQRS